MACPNPSAEILGIASWLGVTHLFRMGGAQAIAALAYGTERFRASIESLAPGNIYVAAAKKLIAGEVGIDFVAVSNGDRDHRRGRQRRVDCCRHAGASGARCGRVIDSLNDLSRAGEQEWPKKSNGNLPRYRPKRLRVHRLTTTERSSSSMRWSERLSFQNALAPEHLALHDPFLLGGIKHAGAVFLGPSSPEAAGDYASGPNHVLPTSGAARLRGGTFDDGFCEGDFRAGNSRRLLWKP